MERRTLLRNLVSTVAAIPVTKIIANAVVEPDDESHMRKAIQLAANNPKNPFAAVLVDQDKRVVAEGWNRSALNPTWSRVSEMHGGWGSFGGGVQ